MPQTARITTLNLLVPRLGEFNKARGSQGKGSSSFLVGFHLLSLGYDRALLEPTATVPISGYLIYLWTVHVDLMHPTTHTRS